MRKDPASDLEFIILYNFRNKFLFYGVGSKFFRA
jgi:hypothetical protein